MKKDKENKPSKWSECDRDDLRGIELASKFGFTTVFDYNDYHYKRTTITDVPHECVSFKLIDSQGNELKTLWKIYNLYIGILESHWRCADLIEGHYHNHRTYDTIETAFEIESIIIR